MPTKQKHSEITEIKTALIKRGWGEAIELLDCVAKHNPAGLAEWLRTKSTTYLMQICEPFRNWSIYGQRNTPLPFDNDVYALDAVGSKAQQGDK